MPRQLSLKAIIEKNKLCTDSAMLVLLAIYLNNGFVVRIVQNTEDIYWRGDLYQKFPFEFGKIGEKRDGSDPTVEIMVDNTSRQLEEILREANGLRVELYVVNTHDLDNNVPVIDYPFTVQKASSNERFITFTLGAEYSAKTRRPLNRYMKNNCPFKYKGIRCGYTGDLPECGKTLVECRNHNNSQRFGGFPGIDQQGAYAT